MPTFVPPTRNIAVNPETEGGELERHSMWRHYGSPIPVGYTVLITSGVASTYPGLVSPSTDQIAAADAGSGEEGLAYFRGGIEYTITSAEDAILTSAGYTVKGFNNGFNNGFA